MKKRILRLGILACMIELLLTSARLELRIPSEKENSVSEAEMTAAERKEPEDELPPGTETDSSVEEIPDPAGQDAPKESDAEATRMPVRPVPALPDTADDLSGFVPEGWILLDFTESDFDGDGITDYVGVLDHDNNIDEIDEEITYLLSPRILFAVFGNREGSYRLSFQDANLIRAGDEGGIWGDPYQLLTAEGTSFTTHAFGGSAWKWEENFTYSYEEGEWYLTEAEDIYSYQGYYITSYQRDDYLAGVGIRKLRSDTLAEMEDYWNLMEEASEAGQDPCDELFPYDLVYEVALDAPPTLYQASMRWWLAPDRRTDWEVKSVEIAEGVVLEQDETVKWKHIVYCDEDQVLYEFCMNEKEYLAIYRFAEQKVYVAAEASIFCTAEIHKDKLYYFDDVRAPVSYWADRNGEKLLKEEVTIGVRLYRANLDGSDRTQIFEYLLPLEEQEVMARRPPHLSLKIEAVGDEIIVEVSIDGELHPYYRIDLDGSHPKLLGTVPAQ